VFGVAPKHMYWLCHQLGTMLDAGLPTSRALEVLVGQAPTGRLRKAIRSTARAVEKSTSLAEGFERQGCFPDLFLTLVGVGEDSGTLDRTMLEAGRFYELQQRLWRTFMSRILLPVTQYVIAIAVIAFATHLVNVLQEKPGGATPILVIGYGLPVALIAAYQLLLKPLGGLRAFHELLLATPVISGVVRSLALSRFSLVMYLMMEAGVPIRQALLRAFETTGNGAFAARGPAAADIVAEGADLTKALSQTRLFPREYMDIVQVAEESGKLSGRFEWLANHHTERAEFALGVLVTALARLIWLVVAIIIIVFIFKFFSFYLNAMSGAGM